MNVYEKYKESSDTKILGTVRIYFSALESKSLTDAFINGKYIFGLSRSVINTSNKKYIRHKYLLNLQIARVAIVSSNFNPDHWGHTSQ